MWLTGFAPALGFGPGLGLLYYWGSHTNGLSKSTSSADNLDAQGAFISVRDGSSSSRETTALGRCHLNEQA